jgi:hypothetical protein
MQCPASEQHVWVWTKKIKEKKEESHRLHTTKTQGLQTET